jgi:hypothetical protein
MRDDTAERAVNEDGDKEREPRSGAAGEEAGRSGADGGEDEDDVTDGAADENGGDGGGGAANGGGGGNSGETRSVSLTAPSTRTVDLDEQTSNVGVDTGTFLQRSGVKLFSWVLLVTLFVVLMLFVNLFAELAHLPDVPSGNVLTRAFQRGDTVQTLRLASHYRIVADVAVAQRDSAWAHFVLGVKELVVAVLLPLLTGILGYIFGTRSETTQVSGDTNSADA